MIWHVRIDGEMVGRIEAWTRSEAFKVARDTFGIWGLYDVEPEKD